MKKIYVKPAFEAVEVEIESLMTITSGETDGEGAQPGVEGDGGDLVIGRRGSWGNRWE